MVVRGDAAACAALSAGGCEMALRPGCDYRTHGLVGDEGGGGGVSRLGCILR